MTVGYPIVSRGWQWQWRPTRELSMNDRPSVHAGEPWRHATSSTTTPHNHVGLGRQWTLASRRCTVQLWRWTTSSACYWEQWRSWKARRSACWASVYISNPFCHLLRDFGELVSQGVGVSAELVIRRLDVSASWLSATLLISNLVYWWLRVSASCWRIVCEAVYLTDPNWTMHITGSLSADFLGSTP